MNLYLFNANDSAAVFGIGTYLRELVGVLGKSTIRIHVVHLHASCTEFRIEKTEPAENWYIPEVYDQNTFSGSVKKMEDYYLNVTYLLRLHIKDTKDLVFHFNYNQSFYLAKTLKKSFNCKTIATVHFSKWSQILLGNISLLHILKSMPENQRSPYEKLLLATDEYECMLYHEVDKVIALTADMKNFLSSEYHVDKAKIHVIPHGMSDNECIDSFHNSAGDVSDINMLRNKWRLTENEKIILFAGRLAPVKGLVYLIDAFRKVLDTVSNSRLIISGSGHYDIYFQATKDIVTKVSFTGLMGKNELYELYQVADVGVIPSLYEPFGLVALEMMIHRLPIVATATSGLNEVVDEGCGLKVPVHQYPDRVEIDSGLLAEKIIYLLQHPEQAQEMGKNGRKRYEKLYTTDVFRKNMTGFYQSLLEQ